MAGTALQPEGPIRITDYLSLGLLARLVPPTLVDAALTEQDRHGRRQCDLYFFRIDPLIRRERLLCVVTEGMEYLDARWIRP